MSEEETTDDRQLVTHLEPGSGPWRWPCFERRETTVEGLVGRGCVLILLAVIAALALAALRSLFPRESA